MNEDEANESAEMVATSGIKWPDVPRLVFAPGPDPHANVRLDWVFTGHDDARFAYAEGYREAIEAIHEKAVARGIVIEHAIFPLAFLWRHRLELHLKGALRDAKSLWCEEHRPPNHHDLLKLWLELKPYAVDLGTPGTPEIENVEANIVEFQKVDPGADGFRYPTDRKGGPSLTAAPRVVDLNAFHEAMEAVVPRQENLWASHGGSGRCPRA